MKNKIKKMSGFTLFEMLVVISIIAILTATISLSFSSAQKKARDSRRISDMNAIQKAMEQYYSQKSYVYPTASTDLTSGTGSNPAILGFWPKDPKSGVIYSCVNPWVNTSYCCCTLLENASTGNSTTASCNFASSGSDYYCVKNQQ